MTYRLHYFAFKGRAEAARMMLFAAGQKFEDVTWSVAEWPEVKKTSPTGKSPWLEVDGHVIPESYAINRFLANRFGFAGKDEFEKATVDSTADFLADTMKDIRDYVLVVNGLVKDDKEKVYKEKFIPTLEKTFNYIQDVIKKSGNGFVVPSGITWVDFVIAEMFCFLLELEPKVEQMFPEMADHEKRVHNHPKVKHYVDSRKDVKLSFFSK